MSNNNITINLLNKHFETTAPHCILHTRTGCIPHLTNETLGYLKFKSLPNVFEVPVSSVIDHVDTLKECESPATECFALPRNCLTYGSIRDHSLPLNRGYNTKKAVGLWGIGGKISVTSKDYMSVIVSLKPDLYEVLADEDVTESDARKRATKSVDRTDNFLNECLMIHKDNDTLKNSKILCMIEGGMWMEERERSVKLTHETLREHQMESWGYVIDALQEEQILSEKTKAVVKSTIKLLPQNKPVFVHGFGHPLAIIDLCTSGVSVFDSSYITAMSEKKYAAVYKMPNVDNNNLVNDMPIKENDYEEKDFKETICLSDECHVNSFIPLVENCQCYTCAHHTRAYLHHLCLVNEMLGPVLLMLHNLHHHFMFFGLLKQSLKSSDGIEVFRTKLTALNIPKQ